MGCQHGISIPSGHRTCASGNASAAYTIPANMLAWNTVYYARVMVWDNFGNASSWTSMKVCNPVAGQTNRCLTGGVCSGAQTNCWRTPPHAYPSPDFNYLPLSPTVNGPITFTDNTVFSGALKRWLNFQLSSLKRLALT